VDRLCARRPALKLGLNKVSRNTKNRPRVLTFIDIVMILEFRLNRQVTGLGRSGVSGWSRDHSA
jgi:hypothetical protein